MSIKVNTEARKLTVGKSSANAAHKIWYSKLSPSQRYELGQKIEKAYGRPMKISDKLNACLNHIEDNLSDFE